MQNNKSTKALFLLYEGIGATIFNSQVAVHVADMKNSNVYFDILTFETWAKCWKSSNANLKKFNKTYPDIKLFLRKGINIFFPLVNLYNAILLIKFLHSNKNKYSFIHARSDYSAFISILTKPIHRIPVIWDCRGDSVSELVDSLSRKKMLMRYFGFLYILPAMRFRIFVNSKFASKVIFVSNALKNLYIKNLKTSYIKTIPCPVSESKFYFDAKLRNAKREDLKIKHGDLVFMYSGSMTGYQYTSGLENIFKEILKDDGKLVLIITSEPGKARNIFKSLSSEKIIILESAFDEMVSFYNAADFGILLREDKRLNYVASPTKFGEYSLAGLPVIMNDTVDQCYNFSKLIGNYVSSKETQNKSFSIEQRNEIAKSSRKFYARNNLNQLYLDLYHF